MEPGLSLLSPDWMLDDVRRRFGLAGGHGGESKIIGAELELIPVRADNLLPVPIESHTTACSMDVLRELAARHGWCEVKMGTDPSSWTLGGGARISFEPGGQIEISSSPHSTASAVIAELTETCGILNVAFERHAVNLETVGVDPNNSIARVPLQLHRERYEAMTRYFDSIGPSGIRMMRQTASVQINVQPGVDPIARWSLLNRLAPVLVAIFANSSRYADADSGHVSYRANLWRTLDKSRTGVHGAEDAVREYCEFALDAGSMFKTLPSGEYQSFRSAIANGASEDDWDVHLTTLFPEIRPKGYFEVRSPDMVEPRWLAAPIGIVAGLCYDDEAAESASALLPVCDNARLLRAGETGVHDPELGTLARELCEIAIQGCKSLGPDYLSQDDLDTVIEFFDRYPANGRCPADDQ